MVYSPYQSDAVKTLGTVYVVDDDEAIRDSIRWLLEASDYNVELYESGESLIAHYNQVWLGLTGWCWMANMRQTISPRLFRS